MYGFFFCNKHFTICYNNDIMYVQGGEEMANLTKRIAFRCTEEEFEMIKDQADCNGQTMTDYIKFLVLEDSEPIDGENMTMRGGE